MAERTIIAWTDRTFNIAWGCVKVSPGCANCYADALATRYGHSVWGARAQRRTFGLKHWAQPLRWQREAAEKGIRYRVFTSSMSDVFLDEPAIQHARTLLWEVVRSTPNLDWQILTKRPENIPRMLPPDWGTAGYPNVWLGVSVENAEYVSRAAVLAAIPARIRFISYEPALGPIHEAIDLRGIQWVICGGESGARFRPMDLAWARGIRDRCKAEQVAFFFKQSSHRFTERGTELDGETVREFPGR